MLTHSDRSKAARFVAWLSLLAVAVLLALPAAADGLIIARPIAPMPEPWPLPQPVPYRFAPMQVDYHHVRVSIDGQVATTEIDQVFINPLDVRLEGEYIFPIPSGAHIDRFSMDIDGRQVEAELLDAEKARKIYTDIVRSMQDPALLEYVGTGLYKVRIFPIEPKSKKHIRLKYTQLLSRDEDMVGYTYPLNTEKFSSTPIRSVKVDVKLKTESPIKNIYSPSHSVAVKRAGEREATVTWEAKDARPDTDFQVFYSTDADRAVDVRLMTYRNPQIDEAGYFMLLASPGFIQSRKDVVDRDVVFVLDTSGSMAGEKMKQAQKALHFCVHSLNAGDRFEVIRFSTETEAFFGKLTGVDDASRARAVEFVNSLKATGGTAIEAALSQAVAIASKRSESGRPLVVIFLTDGKPTIGSTDEGEILGTMARARGDQAVRVFSFGIGTDINTHLLDRIALDTKAVSQYVLPEEDIEVKVSSFYTKISAPVLTDLKLAFSDAVRVSQMHPSALPDLFKGDQLVVFGRYTGSGDTAIELTGRVNDDTQRLVHEATFADSTTHAFIPRMWATRRVGYLLEQVRLHGENVELKQEITDLARQHGIVTPYTSYLIVEDEATRNVPADRQSFPEAARRAEVRGRLAKGYDSFKDDRDGREAVGGSMALDALKEAKSAAAPAAAAEVSESGAAGESTVMSGRLGVEYAKRLGDEKLKQVASRQASIQQTVVGRNFFFNGHTWLDAQVPSSQKTEKPVEPIVVTFGSEAYFKLLDLHPDVPRILSLGDRVTFMHDGKVYQVEPKA